MTVSRAGGEICAGSDDVVGGASTRDDVVGGAIGGAGVCDGVACGVSGIRAGTCDKVACVVLLVLALCVPEALAPWVIAAVLVRCLIPATISL